MEICSILSKPPLSGRSPSILLSVRDVVFHPHSPQARSPQLPVPSSICHPSLLKCVLDSGLNSVVWRSQISVNSYSSGQSHFAPFSSPGSAISCSGACSGCAKASEAYKEVEFFKMCPISHCNSSPYSSPLLSLSPLVISCL